MSQQVQKLVHQNFVSFFGLLRLKKSQPDLVVNIPKYLDKISGRLVLTYTQRVIPKTSLKHGFLTLTGTSIKIKTSRHHIQFVRIIPKNNMFVIEIGYKVDAQVKQYNGKVAGIDLGLNNLATVTSSEFKPLIINGKPLKSINHFYNKRLANLKSKQDIAVKNGLSQSKTTRRIKQLTDKRNNKINDYLHQSSRYLVNHLVSCGIAYLIIGYNKGWKQDINIGKRNNQNFVQIPFLKFVNMIRYKCELAGIVVLLTEESHTSKCSFLDSESVKHHKSYKGRRIKRGLFRSAKGILINADVNGSANILVRGIKAAGKRLNRNLVQVCGTPTVFTVKR